MSVHRDVCEATGLSHNKVDVLVKRLGGAFGGKTTRSPYFAVAAALGARKTNRPVKVCLYRGVDTAFMGKRHPYFCKSLLAVGTGSKNPGEKGKIMGRFAEIWADGGATYDCSFTVLDRVMLKSDGPYQIANTRTTGDVCRTNKATNTAMRSFGMIQAALVLEEGVERAAHGLGMLPEDLRRANFNQLGDVTPYGESLDYCYMTQVFDYVLEESDFYNRLPSIEKFNAENRWRKRGISVIPVQYGLGYNAEFLQQGEAHAEVFATDGSVLIRTGGIENGQGLATKMAQLMAGELNIPLGLIQVAPFDSGVIPNPSSTGASTGTELNGGAVVIAAREINKRLKKFAYELLGKHGSAWCADNGVNFWDFDDGWGQEIDKPDGSTALIWQNIVSLAYNNRVALSCHAHFDQPGGTNLAKNVTFKPDATGKTYPEKVTGFLGNTYSAACVEVEIDVLTGITRILRADVCYDNGKSLNPAIDVGQVEGAFIQGVGNMLTEQVVYNQGAQAALNTWDYKIPSASTIPEQFNVILFPRASVKGAPENPNLINAAKAIGEPPLVLAASVFFAVKHAVLAARKDRDHDEWFELESPATPERVSKACLVDWGE
ncbi:MAG: molybdopterin-dependent oxidoreductase [Desulfobacterales bacterium]|nr:molybdopterin-dependent oxidoreductase [Desulfobacterales bacterium]